MKQPVGFAPFVSDQVFTITGVRCVDLNECLRSSDLVSVHCPLNEQTRGLIGVTELRQMKPDENLLNTARAFLQNGHESLESRWRISNEHKLDTDPGRGFRTAFGSGRLMAVS